MSPDFQVLEENFNPNNLEEIKDNKHFHHSCKGCDILMIVEKDPITSGKYSNYSVKKYCNTHQVMCSKTGWELGWYLGQRTKDIYDATGKNSKYSKCDCGKRYIDKGFGMCNWCFKKINPDAMSKVEKEKKAIIAYRATYRNKINRFMDEGLDSNKAKEKAKKWMDENYKK